MTRPRAQILANLEALYRESFSRASESGDQAAMQRLDFDFRRDQLYLEAILDVRDLLAGHAPPAAGAGAGAGAGPESTITEHIGELRKLTRFPFGR